MTAPLAFVDTETTDIGPRRLAWELAVIRREPDGTRKELQTYIEVDLADANPYALAVGGFYDRHPLGKWLAGGVSGHPANITTNLPSTFWFRNDVRGDHSYVTALDAALLWCRWTHGAHIIGAVPNFDTEVMGAASRTAGLLPGHHYHLGDVENLIAGYLRGRLDYDGLTGEERARIETLSTPPWSSDDLFAEIGVTTPDTERHTALGDARTCERVWDALYGTRAATHAATGGPR